MSNRKTLVAIAIIMIIVLLSAGLYYSLSANTGNGKVDDVNDTVTFLIEDGYGAYFWVEGQGSTVMEAWGSAVENYSIPWVQAIGANATWGEVDSVFNIWSVNGTVSWQSWPYWAWWMVYLWSDSSHEWVSGNMESTNSTDCRYCAIYYGNNSEYNIGPTVTPESAVVWDHGADGSRFLIQSPSGLYFWINGEGTTVYNAWIDAATTYNITWTKETDYNGINTLFNINGSGQYYWKLYLINIGGNWIDRSSWGEDDLSSYVASDYSAVAMVYGNWETSGPIVGPSAT